MSKYTYAYLLRVLESRERRSHEYCIDRSEDGDHVTYGAWAPLKPNAVASHVAAHVESNEPNLAQSHAR